MKSSIILIVFVIFTFYDFVHSLGENVNFDEFLKMVNNHINTSLNYVIPKNNLELVDAVKSPTKNFGNFDFIIIGAGAAGAVLANRLSEISKWQILLLEAGGPDDDFTKILGFSTYLYKSNNTWGYNTTSQKNGCLGMVNHQCFMPLGKVAGGGTTVNAAIYSRGSYIDFDRWENVYGNPGWSYKQVLPYFKKSEKAGFRPVDPRYHGECGYADINYNLPSPKLAPHIYQAFEEIGEKQVDYNGQDQLGINNIQFFMTGNERVNTASAFLRNFTTRRNLVISLKSFVTKLLINKVTKTAYGVEFVKNGQTFTAKARKEVILSAGATNSPQILMLSGIGPKDHLEELGIPVIRDLPVGKNFQDHIMFLGVVFRTNQIFYNQTFEEALKSYTEHRRPLTAPLGMQMISFTNFAMGNSSRPEVEFIFVTPNTTPQQAAFSFGFDEDHTAAMITNTTSDLWVIQVLLHPKSRGEVKLKSSSPIDKPLINPNYFSDEENHDLETLYKGVQFLLKLNETQAMKKFEAHFDVYGMPKCDPLFERLSKEWWFCAFKHFSTTIYHPSSTTRMSADPTTSVVNSKLQVYGMKRLRVVDGGILPELNSGHTSAPIIMVAEKAADIIKEDHRKLLRKISKHCR